MSYIQDRLRSISTALKNFDRQEASFSDAGSDLASQASESVSMAASDAQSEMSGTSNQVEVSRGSRSVESKQAPDNSLASLVAGQPSDPAPQPTPAKKKSMIWIVVIVVVLLIAFGIILYVIYKKRKQAQNGDNKKEKPKKFDPTAMSRRPARSSNDPFSQIDALDRPKQARRTSHDEDFVESVAIPGGQPPIAPHPEPEDDDIVPL